MHVPSLLQRGVHRPRPCGNTVPDAGSPWIHWKHRPGRSPVRFRHKLLLRRSHGTFCRTFPRPAICQSQTGESVPVIRRPAPGLELRLIRWPLLRDCSRPTRQSSHVNLGRNVGSRSVDEFEPGFRADLRAVQVGFCRRTRIVPPAPRLLLFCLIVHLRRAAGSSMNSEFEGNACWSSSMAGSEAGRVHSHLRWVDSSSPASPVGSERLALLMGSDELFKLLGACSAVEINTGPPTPIHG